MTANTITFRINESRTLVATDGTEIIFELTTDIPASSGDIRKVRISHDGKDARYYSIGTARAIWTDLTARGATEDTRFAAMAI